MTKAEYDAMVAGKDAEENDNAPKGDNDSTKASATAQSKDNIVEIGTTTKKRKVAKVIAEDGEAQESNEPVKKVVKKAKKKGKPVKLSFGDEEAA
jgi:uncharacterized protein YabE (DUF348 family)